MIRLVALREALEINRISAAEMNMLCLNRQDFKDLAKVLPYALPTEDARQLAQAQSLSGIKTAHLNARREVPYTQMQMTRIRRYEGEMQGWICNQDVCKHTYEEYIQIAKNFWYTVLKPLQLPDYYEGNLTEYEQFYIVWKLSRTAALTRIFIRNPEAMDVLHTLSSLPAPHIGDLCYRPSDHLGQANFMRMCGATNLNYRQYTATNDWKILDTYVDRYLVDVCKIYNLIIKLNCKGIINDKLMEGEYEHIWNERNGIIPDAGSVEQPESSGCLDF